MTTQSFNTADELRRIIEEGRVSDEALQAITGISGDALASFVAAPSGEPGLTAAPQPFVVPRQRRRECRIAFGTVVKANSRRQVRLWAQVRESPRLDPRRAGDDT